MYDLVTFGEAMIRLTAPEFMRLEQVSSLSITAGGAEMNVAVNAAQLGLKTAWVSRLVDNWSGRYIRNKGRELVLTCLTLCGSTLTVSVSNETDFITLKWGQVRERVASPMIVGIRLSPRFTPVKLIGHQFLVMRVGFT